MTKFIDERNEFKQCLLDLGCNHEKIEKCMVLAENEKVTGLLKFLSEHRSVLLENLHESQKKIDCLDYIVFQIKK